MITTEEQIVYQLLTTIRAGELNQDEVIEERDIRALIRTHRADLLVSYSRKGLILQDICFQQVSVPVLSQEEVPYEDLVATIPSIMELPDFQGVKCYTKRRTNIHVVNEESYWLEQKHPVDKYQPKAMVEYPDKLRVYPGTVPPQTQSGGALITATINTIKNDGVIISAVLRDPEQADSYDWKTDAFPLPEELIQSLKDNILRKEFNVVLQTKSDQITNMKNDTLRYHDQGAVNR